MSEKMGMDNPEMPEKKEDEKEILKKALPIILQRYEKYPMDVKHPGDDGGLTADGYMQARYQFEKFLKSLGE